MARRPQFLISTLLALLGPLLVFYLLRTVPDLDPRLQATTFHFWIVSLAAVVGLLAAAVVLRASVGRDDIWVFFAGLGLLSISSVFLLHSLATENVLLGASHPSFSTSPPTSLAVGALFFGLSAIPYNYRFERLLVRYRWAISTAWLAAYAAYVVLLFVAPAIMPGVAAATGDSAGYGYGYGSALGAETGFPLIPTIMGGTVVLFGAAILQYLRLLRRRDSGVVVALILGAILFVDSQILMMVSPLWHASWWIYHILLLAGFGVVAYALLLEFRRTREISTIFDGLSVCEARERVADNFNEATIALVAAVEAKDLYTRGHSSRVADYSTELATQLDLPRGDVERIRNAAVLHDIGKIALAEHVLNKEGPLDDNEFAAIRAHPAAGHSIVEGVPSLHEFIPGIRHHHERMDGSGYPDGIKGDAIHLDARVIAVADVFDALTSERSYREAWSAERALEILREESGSHFDPAIVQAFVDAGITSTWQAGPAEVPAAATDRE